MTNPYIAPHLAEMPMHRVLVRSAECLLLSEVSIDRPLLDIGSGDGHFAATLFPEPVDVGLDPDKSTMSEAVRRGGYRSLVAGSATDLPLKDGSLATVLCNSTFEHIPDVDAAILEAGRVLRAGGLLLTTMPSEYFNGYMLPSRLGSLLRVKALGEGYVRWFNRLAQHYHIDPPEVWTGRFEAAGLEVIRQRYYFTPSSHVVFELSHYLGAPSLLVKRFLGRWVLWPGKARLKPVVWAVSQAARLGPSDRGAGLFFVCRKVSP